MTEEAGNHLRSQTRRFPADELDTIQIYGQAGSVHVAGDSRP